MIRISFGEELSYCTKMSTSIINAIGDVFEMVQVWCSLPSVKCLLNINISVFSSCGISQHVLWGGEGRDRVRRSVLPQYHKLTITITAL